jgi:hypothetical protein
MNLGCYISTIDVTRYHNPSFYHPGDQWVIYLSSIFTLFLLLQGCELLLSALLTSTNQKGNVAILDCQAI